MVIIANYSIITVLLVVRFARICTSTLGFLPVAIIT